MMLKRSMISACLLAAGTLLVGSSGALLHAAESVYPNKPISLIVPIAPGGLTDMGARAFAETMEKQFKQPVVVVNKPGGAGTVGGYQVVSAKPDGYTLGYFMNSAAVPEAFSYFYSAPYTSDDLKPICRVHLYIIAVTVRADAPWNSLQDLIEYARKNPRMKFAHNGKATLQYAVMTAIAKAEKLNLVDVPYEGDAAAVPAILGGHVPVAIPAYGVVKPLLDAKKVKILALVAEKRVPFAPDIPVIGEMGYKLPYYSPFSAIFAPKKTPDQVVKRIDEVVHRITEDKDFQAKNKSLDLIFSYEDTRSFEKYLAQYKAGLQAFFKEEGLEKK